MSPKKTVRSQKKWVWSQKKIHFKGKLLKNNFFCDLTRFFCDCSTKNYTRYDRRKKVFLNSKLYIFIKLFVCEYARQLYGISSSSLTDKSIFLEMSNWSKNLGNSHSHLNLKTIAVRNSHSDVNFQNSIPILESIQFSIQNLVFYVLEQK